MAVSQPAAGLSPRENDDFLTLPPEPGHPLNPPGRQLAIRAVMAAERGEPMVSAAVPASPGPVPAISQASISGRRPDGRLDWRWVARQLAAGRTVEELADELKCKPSRIRRTLGRSPRFLRLVEAERERRLQNLAQGLDQLRDVLLAGLARAAAAGDPRVMLWLGARLPGFLAPPRFQLAPGAAKRQTELAEHWRTGRIPDHWPRALKEQREAARHAAWVEQRKHEYENEAIVTAAERRSREEFAAWRNGKKASRRADHGA